MIQSLLIANRGEIACRIIRTARRLGLRTVAIYSDADADALHVRMADEAVHVGASPVRESYLLADRIIAAAKRTGAEAIHPGYGFLSENVAFAEDVQDAGLVWVGPNPSSIAAMGLKDAAKALMQKAGVPTTPGYLGEDQSSERLKREADTIGYPVLIKAVAGGGGKGMRKVDAPEDFADALLSCQREAASSFANDRVLLEKWIATPRHIEVQVFGDTHGNVVHLFERDCSLQRRHQKVIEEAPAPGMSEEARARICQAAINAAKAVNYFGAGTIEFIADASAGLHADKIWFMEMNTRLQVEHPVTEQITGQDLVEWQLRVASGEPLPRRQDELAISGWAMEARLYAEDPAKGFLPSMGRLDLFEIGDGCRIDTGVEHSTEISPFYDPMIAKVIASGPDRETARRALVASLEGTKIWPLHTNAGFLVRTLQNADFIEARLDTELIAREGDALIPPDRPSEATLAKAVAEALASPRNGPAGFRLNAPPRHEANFLLNDAAVTVPFDPGQVTMAQSHKTAAVETWVAESGQVWKLRPWRVDGGGGVQVSEGTILSSMPGKIVAVSVKDGEAVVKGQKLVTLEAMKMEHSLTAPFAGTITELNAHEGAQVSEGTLLVKVTPKEEA